MRFSPRRERPNYRMGQLTSLLDVIFLLLIFFMVTTTFSRKESELQASIRSSGTSSEQTDLQPQVVRVTLGAADEILFLVGENRTTSRDSLTALLEQLPKDPGVFVRADHDVPWRGPAAALQACEDAGFEIITYVPTE